MASFPKSQHNQSKRKGINGPFLEPGFSSHSKKGTIAVEGKASYHKGTKKFENAHYSQSNSASYDHFSQIQKIPNTTRSIPKNSAKPNQVWSNTSDSDSANAYSSLAGFKIVQNGRVIHDETEEEPNKNQPTFHMDKFSGKYASSDLTIGPTSKEISIPTFIDL